MKKTKIFLILLLISISGMCNLVNAQSISRPTTSTAGGTIIGSSNQINFNIGESLNSTISGGGNIITQGFEQPGEAVKIETCPGNLTFKAKPNACDTTSDYTISATGSPIPDFTFEYSGFCAIESRLSSAAGHLTHFVVQKSIVL